MRIFFTLLFAIFTISCSANSSKIAIVIDDIGYRVTDKAALSLPEKVTLSFLPHTPYGQSLAELAYAQKKEILLHVPMESSIGKKLGPGALTSDMNEASIRESLNASFKEIPYAIGINNHMGSHLTTLYQPMAWTMNYLKEKQLLFLDSVTSPQSKGYQIAKQFGVPVMSRNIFLDNQLEAEYISGQFRQLIEKAKQNRFAIGIAHPHPESIAMLNKLIPTLKKHGIELVKLSSLYQLSQHRDESITTAD